MNGIDSKHLFVCPQDGIAGTKCNDELPLKPATAMHEVTNVTVPWNQIIIYVLLGPDFKGRERVFDWWLSLFHLDFPADRLDFVIIGLSCPSPVDRDCNDGSYQTFVRLNETYSTEFLDIAFVRTRPQEDGLARLACKALFGMQHIALRYQTKQWFFKIDDDTLVFPNRLQLFISTVSLVHQEGLPVYFGTILNDHRAFELCDGLASKDPPYGPVYGEAQKDRQVSTDVCQAQGGAGYGYNRIALDRAFLNVSLCVPEMDLDFPDEDGTSALHCSAPHSLHCTSLYCTTLHCTALRSYITFPSSSPPLLVYLPC